MNEIDRFTVGAADIGYVGTGLSRPECIIAEPDGVLWVADNRGTVTRIDGDGRQRLLGRKTGIPNGMAMTRDGRLVVADIERGCVYSLDPAGGEGDVLLDRFEGRRLGAVNFVHLDDRGRLWVTVSTVTEPRSAALETVVADGYLLLVEGSRVRLAADGLRFTN